MSDDDQRPDFIPADRWASLTDSQQRSVAELDRAICEVVELFADEDLLAVERETARQGLHIAIAQGGIEPTPMAMAQALAGAEMFSDVLEDMGSSLEEFIGD